MRRVGPYRLGALLGRGGMGEVYRAHDERLGRDVAVKLLKDLAVDAVRRRFADEARAAGVLNHPNVLTVFDVGEADGAPYVVTELLEGETLRQRLQRGRPSPVEAVDWTRQVCAGVGAAHAAGIVHRDLKPENLFLTASGVVKVLDFGLAKRSLGPRSGDETAPGTLLGTVGYMAPEQARGGHVDARADVFAIGAVLFELLCGRRAFTGPSPLDTVSAVLRDDPPWPSAGVAPGLLAVCRRCLEKDPSQRYADAAGVAEALRTAGDDAGAVAGSPRARAFGVPPFRDLSRDGGLAALGLGLAGATVAALAAVRGLDVRPVSALGDLAGADAMAAAREMGVDVVVDGAIQAEGSRVRVSLRLLETSTGRAAWAGRVDGDAGALFALEDEVARVVAAAVDEQGAAARRAAPSRPPAQRAYELYLRGKARLFAETLGDLIGAVDLLEQARTADPAFAPAWAGLADAYARIAYDFQPTGDWYARAEAACARALELDPALPEGRYVRARLRWAPQGGWDHAGALRDLVSALRARPSMEEARVRLGTVLWHLGLLDEAEPHLEEAVRLNPRHVLALDHQAMLFFLRGDYVEAGVRALRLWREAATTWAGYMTAQSRLRWPDLREAEDACERMLVQHPRDPKSQSTQGVLHARRGEKAPALEIAARLAEVDEPYGHFHHVQYDLACIHAAFGDAATAATFLRACAASGMPCAPLVKRDPLLDAVRGMPEFEAVVAEYEAATAGWARFYAAIGADEVDEAVTV